MVVAPLLVIKVVEPIHDDFNYSDESFVLKLGQVDHQVHQLLALQAIDRPVQLIHSLLAKLLLPLQIIAVQAQLLELFQCLDSFNGWCVLVAYLLAELLKGAPLPLAEEQTKQDWQSSAYHASKQLSTQS